MDFFQIIVFYQFMVDNHRLKNASKNGVDKKILLYIEKTCYHTKYHNGDKDEENKHT